MKTYRSEGDRLIWTNDTGLAVASGDVVVVGDMIGIAVADIASLAQGTLDFTEKEFELTAVTAEAVAYGKAAYYDAGAGKVTSTAAGNTAVGFYSRTKSAGQTTAYITRKIPGLASTVNVPADTSVTAAKLAGAVQDAIPKVAVSASAEVAHARTITLQVQDAAGNALAQVCTLRMTVNATGAFGTPAATATDTFAGPTAGLILTTNTAKQDYIVQTDATGKYVFALTHNDAGTNRYIAAFMGGLGVSSGALAMDAV